MEVLRFHLPALGQAATLAVSELAGQALLLDPRRDVDAYLEACRARGARLAYVLDSHGHNDHVSGISEVAARAPGVRVLASAHGTVGYDHVPVRDGQEIELGEAVVEVMHTPGHTPEHLALLLRDASLSGEPVALLSGGALLVGDVARPDLLGDAEEVRENARAACRTLVERILPLPDHVEVYPTHVAGSLCGSRIGSRLSTTIGLERRTNPALLRLASGATDGGCLDLADLPAVPPYWRRMRPMNLAGPPLLGPAVEPPALPPAEVEALLAGGALPLDCRSVEAFAGGHLPGSLHVELGPSFPTWAGTVLPEGARVVLVVDRPADVAETVLHLLRIGYDPPLGWLRGGVRAWKQEGRPVGHVPTLDVGRLRDLVERREVEVLDVRQPAEWRAGHIEGARFITGAELPARLGEVPRDRPVAVICGSGYRSSVAASLLARSGVDVRNVAGGMGAWLRAGHPVVPG
ncbi:MAG TPA: rhodanese-like domain-containing protein [Actinomycetota bacterium]|nr:rhodanese-like domain-containing protein [Actinomycetota bacterium]